MQRSNWKIMTILCSAVFMLSACDVSSPSLIGVKEIRVKETMATATLDAHDVNISEINIVADQYLRRGRGVLTLTMPYLSGDRQKESVVRKRSGLYKKAFYDYGVAKVNVDYIAVETLWHTAKIVASYRSVTALAPEGCGRLPGYQGGETIADIDNYRMGCEVKSAMSRQVADPTDFLGKSGTPNGYSSREGAVIEGYMAGVPNERLDGFAASEIGSGE